MYSFPSTSHTRAPFALFTKNGWPPTARNARTGEFTPPGMYFSASAKSFSDWVCVMSRIWRPSVRSRSRTKFVERNLEPSEQPRFCRHPVRRFAVKLVNAFRQSKYLDGTAFGIDNPIFRNATLFVECLLINPIPFPGLRNHFHRQIRHAANAILNDFVVDL